MKIATTLYDYDQYDIPVSEIFRIARESGFRYLDYSFYNVHQPGTPFVQKEEHAWKELITSYGEAAAKEGLSYVQAHAPGYNPAVECDHETALLAYRRSIEACHILGIPNIVLHTSCGKQHLYPQDRDSYFQFNRKFIEAILLTAEKYGINLCIENSSRGNTGGYYFFMTPAEMNDFIAYMDHPLLAACWDTGHAAMDKKFDQYGELTELGKNLKALHIHDNDAVRDLHLPLYSGLLQIDRIIQALLDMDYKGYFTYEVSLYVGKKCGDGPLAKMPQEIFEMRLKMLYTMAKIALQTYQCYEE